MYKTAFFLFFAQTVAKKRFLTSINKQENRLGIKLYFRQECKKWALLNS